MKKKDKAAFAQGTITIDGTTDSIAIAYREHEERNGQLLAELNHLNLHSAQLLDLSQQLVKAEEKLAQGRARYARMANTDASMTETFSHLLDASEDNN